MFYGCLLFVFWYFYFDLLVWLCFVWVGCVVLLGLFAVVLCLFVRAICLRVTSLFVVTLDCNLFVDYFCCLIYCFAYYRLVWWLRSLIAVFGFAVLFGIDAVWVCLVWDYLVGLCW